MKPSRWKWLFGAFLLLVSCRFHASPAPALPPPISSPLSTATNSPAASTALPDAPAKPDPAEIDISRWSSISPDGKWVATGVCTSPKSDSSQTQTECRLDVGKPNGRLYWTLIDDWSDTEPGYTVPQPLQWSADSRYFYYIHQPVIEGCKALAVNGADLQQVDTITGQVRELLPAEALWITLSPDETRLAYIQQSSLNLIIRDLAFGEEHILDLNPGWEYDAGNLYWSPNGQMLTLTLANHPCMGTYPDSGPRADTTSILGVDVTTLAVRTLIEQDALRHVTTAWKLADEIKLKNPAGDVFILNDAIGKMTAGYCTQLKQQYHAAQGFKTYCDPDYGFAFDSPAGWETTLLTSSPDGANADPQRIRRGQVFSAPDMSNYIRVDTYRLPYGTTLEERVKIYWAYADRKETGHAYQTLSIGGQPAHAFIGRWYQDYSAVHLFFQHSNYFTVMELKVIDRPGLETNWQIVHSIQVPGVAADQNVIPEELIRDSYLLLP